MASRESGAGPALSAEDRERLQEINEHDQQWDQLVDDPVDLAPEWDHDRLRVTERLGDTIRELYDDGVHPAVMVERYNLSRSTVWRHIGGEVEYRDATRVASARCSVMREMAHDGHSRSDIAERFDCSQSTVTKHVSTTASDQCAHETGVPRHAWDGRNHRKVTQTDCTEMRRLAHEGVAYDDIADQFGVSQCTVSKHVTAGAKRQCSHDGTAPRK